MARAHILPHDAVAQFEQLYGRERWTTRAIARHWGCSLATVYHFVHRTGLTLRPRVAMKPRARKLGRVIPQWDSVEADAPTTFVFTDRRLGEMVALRLGGATLQEIGDAVGLTRERVRRLLNRSGAVPPNGDGSQRKRRSASHFAEVNHRRTTRKQRARTERRRQLDILKTFVATHGRAPSLTELALACGYRFPSQVQVRWRSWSGPQALRRHPNAWQRGTARLYRLAGLAPVKKGRRPVAPPDGTR